MGSMNKSGFSIPMIENSSTSWFSSSRSLGIAKRLRPEPWICNEFQVGLTKSISYSLGISSSSTHWGMGGSFIAFNISIPSNSCIIFLYSFFLSKDLIHILSTFWAINIFLLSLVGSTCSTFSISFSFTIFTFLLFLFIISKPSNSWIWFLGFCFLLNEVRLICSILCNTKGSFSFGITSKSYFFLFFVKILKSCKCCGIFLGLVLFDMIVNEFIACISKTASGSVTLSWLIVSSVFIFLVHCSIFLIFWLPIICIPSKYCILWGSFLICSINISFTGEGTFTSFHPILVEITCNSCASWS